MPHRRTAACRVLDWGSEYFGIILFLSVEFSAVIFWLSRKKALPLYQLKRID